MIYFVTPSHTIVAQSNIFCVVIQLSILIQLYVDNEGD